MVNGWKQKSLRRVLFLCFLLVIACCLYKLRSQPVAIGVAGAQERGPLPAIWGSNGVNSNDDATRPYGQYDGHGGYVVTWLRGSNYAGYEGTDQVLSRVSISQPTAIEPLSTMRAPDSQEETVIAVGRRQSLMVWQDLRNGRDYDIYGARVAEDGRLLDAEGFLIAGGAGNQISPTVVFNGSEYIVAWSHFDGLKYIVRSAKVTSSAQVSSPTLEAARNDQHCLRPWLVNAANGVWLFWAEARSTNRLMAKQLSTGQSFPIAPDAGFGGQFTAASDGRFVLLALPIVQGKFYDHADILGVIWDTEKKNLVAVDQSNSKIFQRIGSGPRPGIVWIEDGSESPRKRAFDGNVRGLDVGWDGKSFVAVWSTVIFSEGGPSAGRATNHLILIRRINPSSGAFLDREPVRVLQSKQPLRNPYLLSDGNGQLILLYDTENERGQKLIRSLVL